MGPGQHVRIGGHAATDRGDGFVHQVVSHLGQWLPTRTDGEVALVEAPYGTCQLHARDDGIHLVAAGADHDSASRVADVVGRHFELFGATVTWDPAASVAS